MRQTMKTCVLDGATLADAAAVYRRLSEAFGAPKYFGHNPDALWDAITDYHGEPMEIVWKNSALSAARLGHKFEQIGAVLQRAQEQGRLKLRLE
jgi:RNAse (barnase) inhibitor barstar